MKTDIQNRTDINQLLDLFYSRVRADEALGYIFDGVAKVDWPTHLPKIGDFWESLLFGTAVFRGSPMQTHIHLNEQTPLLPEHFERWLQLFHTTIDELFEGEKAEEAKNRAFAIASTMQYKIKSKFTIATAPQS